MRHYLLTRSRRGPDYPIEANLRRIELARRITARSLAAQDGEWTWLVYVHPDDPFLEMRLDAFRSAGHPVVAIADNAGAMAAIDWSGPVLTTRIDDDDAFARDAFARLYAAIRPPRQRTAYIFPVGHRIHAGLSERIVHLRNSWASLYAPAGDRVHVRMVAHPKIPAFARVEYLGKEPGWLWVRHQDDENGFRRAHDLITPELRATYPVDWDLLAPRVAA